jgi:hypothetical protein
MDSLKYRPVGDSSSRESPPMSTNSRSSVSLRNQHKKTMSEYFSCLKANGILSIQFPHPCHKTGTWTYSSSRTCVGSLLNFSRCTSSSTHSFVTPRIIHVDITFLSQNYLINDFMMCNIFVKHPANINALIVEHAVA